MKHDIQWFRDHITSKKTVKRIVTDQKTDKETISYQRVEDDNKAEYLFGLQGEYVRFEENKPRSHGYKKDQDPFKSDEPVVRIHKLDMDSGCESCSA